MPAFEKLSLKQQRIIQSRHPEFLILAGPGTGKTEILTHRIVDIIQDDQGVEQDEILALTFSRKATSEMRDRLNEFTQVDTSDVNISTIHAESLRIYYMLEGSRKYILDKDESTMMIRDTLNDNAKSSRVKDINRLRKDISMSKSNNILPDENKGNDTNNVDFNALYKHYEMLLDYHNAMDFNDVILKPFRMLTGVQYDRDIKHLLIDEFQDINTLEFEMLQILGKNVETLFIVGDDEQSIYGFRGANPTLIKTISNHYQTCITDCLEETYRCCEHIIRGALEIVSIDKNYVLKPIHSATGVGNPIKFLNTRSEGAEAKWIAQWILNKINEGYVEPENIGILSKSLGLLPPIIGELTRKNVETHLSVSGGIFRHKPVRDILSVGRLILDHNDNLALRKCLSSKLATGIGRVGINALRNLAESRQMNYWDAISSISAFSPLQKWRSNYLSFVTKIENMLIDSVDMENEDIISMISTALGVSNEDGVEELTNQVNSFGSSIPFNTVLASIQKNRGLDKSGDGAEPVKNEKAVPAMTMHGSKGLTFDVVFIVGMDQEILPDTTQEIDEQRRLCYVAMTRARNDLFLCHTRKRTGTIARGVSFYKYSNFVKEISPQHIEIIDKT